MPNGEKQANMLPPTPQAGAAVLPESFARDFAARKADMAALYARKEGARRVFLPPVADVKRLAELEGEDFLRAAYERLFGRTAKPEELTRCAEKLSQGTGKAALLFELAASKEGQRRGVRLGGFEEVSLTELLKYTDEAFVENAYALLLGRDADPGGLENNLRALRSGAASPVEILYGLYASPEGRERGVRVPGLEEALRKEQRSRRLRSLPLVGGLFRGGKAENVGASAGESEAATFVFDEEEPLPCTPLDASSVRAAVPREAILSELLDRGGFHIVVADPIPGGGAYELLWQAMQLYLFRAGDAFRVYFFSEADPVEEAALALHSLTDNAAFVGLPDKADILSYFLGCDALLTFSPDGDAAALAKELHLPVICPSLEEGFSFHNGQLFVGRNPYDLAAALRLLREGAYRETFTGRPFWKNS